MLYGEKSREELNDYAEKSFKKILGKKDKRTLYDDVLRKFNVPISTVEAMITFKRDIKEFTQFEIFCVMWFVDRDCLQKYFTEDEINYLSSQKMETEEVGFPITFTNMIQVSDDQWIGIITCSQLMKLKKAKKINYEEGEQRALKRIKSGSVEVWRPFVSNKNVREIKALMESGAYIPDPITLNMPEGSDYVYNNIDNTIVVNSLPKGMFNLDDGYHRYLAMSQIYDFDKSFDYTMELRLVNFSNSKANAFIFQQDQKTPMKKIVSDSYNVNSLANKVIQKVNQDTSCNIQSMIGRNNSKINISALNKLIEYFFSTKNVKKENEISFIISAKNRLIELFNCITEQNEVFLGQYTDQLLFIVIFVFSLDMSKEKMADIILKLYGSLNEEEKKILDVGKVGIRKKAINILNKKVESFSHV